MNLPRGWTITNQGPDGFQLSIPASGANAETLVTVRGNGAHGFMGSVVQPGEGMPVGVEFHGAENHGVETHEFTVVKDGTIECGYRDGCCLRARGKILYANGRVKRVLYAECDAGHQQGLEATESAGGLM